MKHLNAFKMRIRLEEELKYCLRKIEQYEKRVKDVRKELVVYEWH